MDEPKVDNGTIEEGGDSREKLEKNITLFRGVAIVSGTIIGTGIFVTPNAISASVYAPATAIMLMFAGGIVAGLGSLSFSELGTMFPVSGSDMAFLKRIYGALPAFLSLWLLNFTLNGMRKAIQVLGFSKYLWVLIYDNGSPPWYLDKLVGLAVLLLMLGIIAFKPNLALRFIVVWTTLKVLALVLIIIAGFVYLFKGHTENISVGFSSTNTNISDWGAAWNSIIWSFSGWEDIYLVSSEVKNPKKNIPRIVGISVTLVTTLYMLAVASYHIVLPLEIMSNPDVAVAALFGERTMGYPGKIILSISVIISTLGTLNCVLLTGSRVIHAGAAEGMLPGVFNLVSKKYKTPIVAILYLGLSSAMFVVIGNIQTLINSAVFTTFPFLTACAAGVVVLRKTAPDIERPYRCPLLFPVIFTVFGTYVFIVPFLGDSYLLSLVWVSLVLCGIPIYFLCVKNVFNWKFLNIYMEALKTSTSKLLNCD